MYIIVGLGNPGKKYENTRHNVGFRCIDILAKEHNISVLECKHKAMRARFAFAKREVPEVITESKIFCNIWIMIFLRE